MIALLLACTPDDLPSARAPAPALADPEVVRFLALGDAGKGNDTQRRVAAGAARACAVLGCDFVVLLGDNLYPRGMESPHDPRAEERIASMYADAGAPLYLILGNHDYAHGRDRERAAWQIAWADERDGVELPANLWFTDAGPVRLVALDTNAAFQFGTGQQTKWLREQLSGSAATWNVVLGHHPYRSDGPHGNAGTYEGLSYVPWVSGNSLKRLFDEELCGQADLYLSGHEHSRQLISACGVNLVVSGAGASATGIVDRGNDPLFAEGSPGSAWVELGPRSGRVVFVDADGNTQAPHEGFPLAPRER